PAGYALLQGGRTSTYTARCHRVALVPLAIVALYTGVMSVGIGVIESLPIAGGWSGMPRVRGPVALRVRRQVVMWSTMERFGTHGSGIVISLAPSARRQNAACVPRNHELLVGRDHPGGHTARRGADSRPVGFVGALIEFDAEPGGVPTHTL